MKKRKEVKGVNHLKKMDADKIILSRPNFNSGKSFRSITIETLFNRADEIYKGRIR